MPSISDLRQRQALPLNAKILMSQSRIREWYTHWEGDVCVSFSGGKDSTVLANLVHDMYPKVPLIFVNTGLEYPEIQSFAKKMGAEFLRPKMRFDEVISKYGYPIISKEVSLAIYYARRISKNVKVNKSNNDNHWETIKHGEKTAEYYKRKMLGEKKFIKDGKEISDLFNMRKWLDLCNETEFMIANNCCSVMKKTPMAKYQKEAQLYPILGTMAEESRLREQAWLRNGCNAFNSKKKTSQPLSFWTEQDILKYIKTNDLEISKVYGDIVCVDDQGFEYEPLPGIDCTLKCTGCKRTGCMFCAYGQHLVKDKTKFQMLAETHPKQYEYCMGGGQWVDNPKYDPSAPKYAGDWKNWNPKKIWVPSKKGLGMKKVFDDCNKIYGKDFIRYE